MIGILSTEEAGFRINKNHFFTSSAAGINLCVKPSQNKSSRFFARKFF